MGVFPRLNRVLLLSPKKLMLFGLKSNFNGWGELGPSRDWSAQHLLLHVKASMDWAVDLLRAKFLFQPESIKEGRQWSISWMPTVPVISRKFHEQKRNIKYIQIKIQIKPKRQKYKQYNNNKSLQKFRAPTNIGMIQYLHYSYFSKQLLRKKDNFLSVYLWWKSYTRYAILDGKKEQHKPHKTELA